MVRENKEKMSLIHFSLLASFTFFTVHAAASPDQALQSLRSPSNTKHFVLVHGSCHGAWCWFKLVPLLKSSGYNVTAIDLAASGIDPQHVNDLASINDYFRPLTDFMASLPRTERVVLVGHSFGGLAVARVMEEYPEKVSAAVFLAALMPGPSLGVFTVLQEFFDGLGPTLDVRLTFNNSTNLPTTLLFGPRFLSARVYQLSPVEDLTLARTLMRTYRTFVDEPDLSTIFALTEKRYGSVKRVFIVTEKDLTLKKEYQQWLIRHNPPDETVEILGSDHMAMMTKTVELGARLIKIAQKYDKNSG